MERAFFWTGQIKGEAVDRTRARFERWFKNEFLVIHLDHPGVFDHEVEIIAKVNTAGMNHFYSFDTEQNRFFSFVPRRKWTDEHGYTHFVTDMAGDIIISRGALTRREGI